MINLVSLLVLAALVCAVFAALNWPKQDKVQWGWLALACFFASLVLPILQSALK